MRFFVVDDDEVVRCMLAQIIEEEDLGQVVGEAKDGSEVTCEELQLKQVDILLMDLMMPVQDGLETIRQLDGFTGKIVMISQVEAKDMVGEAYALGIEYYITKPINRLEVVSVIRKVKEKRKLEQSIDQIKRSLSDLHVDFPKDENPFTEKTILASGKFLLGELGILGESGSKDLLGILEWLYQYEKEKGEQDFPLLKDLLFQVAQKRLHYKGSTKMVKKEVKAMEQRIRRAIMQALHHLASLGLTDYAHPTFEQYAGRFFDFAEVRKKMLELQHKDSAASLSVRLNPKKFIKNLYFEAKRMMSS